MKISKFQFQIGSSMIEVVVTIIIISIGLLGLGGLQMNALKYQKVSSQRSEAIQAAYDLSDRMRANGAGVSAGNYAYATPYATTVATVPTIPTCAATLCTAAEVASRDIAEWQRDLARRLVQGAGYVSSDGAGNWDVTVMWSEQGYTTLDPACPTGTPPSPGTGVRCYVVRFTP